MAEAHWSLGPTCHRPIHSSKQLYALYRRIRLLSTPSNIGYDILLASRGRAPPSCCADELHTGEEALRKRFLQCRVLKG